MGLAMAAPKTDAEKLAELINSVIATLIVPRVTMAKMSEQVAHAKVLIEYMSMISGKVLSLQEAFALMTQLAAGGTPQ